MSAYDTVRDAILGVPFDPRKTPSRHGTVKAFAEMQVQLEGAQAGALVKATLASLQSLTSVSQRSVMAWVVSDPVNALNGIYENTGTAIAPSWTRRIDIPQFAIAGVNQGLGTANAIQINTDLPVPIQNGRALITFEVNATNTGNVTVSINGETPKSVLTVSGVQIPANAFKENMFVSGFISDGTFRLISDIATVAYQDNAAASAAASAASAASAAVIAAAFSETGVGSTAKDVSDLNTLDNTRFFRSVVNCLNSPTSSAGYGFHIQRNSTNASQFLIVGDKTYHRILNGSWASWVESATINNVVSPTVLRRRYIDVADYVDPNDTLNCHAGIQSAFNAGEGREIVFSNPIGSSRTYRLNNRADGRLYLPQSAILHGGDGAKIEAVDWGRDGKLNAHPVFYGAGTYHDPITRASTIPNQVLPSAGDKTIAMGSTNLNRILAYLAENKTNRWPCYLRSADQYFTKEEGTLGLKAELVWVVGSANGSPTVAQLESPIRDNYVSFGGFELQVAVNLLDLTFNNLNMVGAGRFDLTYVNTISERNALPVVANERVWVRDASGDPAISSGYATYDRTGTTATWVRSLTDGYTGDVGILLVNGGKIKFDGGVYNKFDKHGVHMINTVDFSIRDTEFIIEQDPDFGKLQYPLAIANGCEKGIADNYSVRGGREGVSLTSSGTERGPTRNVTLRNGSHRAHYRSGVAFHDNHENVVVESGLFEDCEQFIDVRVAGRGSALINNRGFRSGVYTKSLDCAVQLGSGAGKMICRNNYWEDVLRGYWMPATIQHEIAPGDFSIHGDVIRGNRCIRGVELLYRGSAQSGYAVDTATLGKLEIIDVDFQMSTATVNPNGGGPINQCGVLTNGKWNEPTITGKFTGGNGTNNVVNMSGDALTGTNLGPINPDVDVKYSSGLLPSRIVDTTGQISLKQKGIGFRAPSETWQAQIYFNPSSLGPGVSSKAVVTGVTGVSTGDNIQIAPDAYDDYMTYHAYANANDSVEVTITNNSAATQNPGGGQFYLTITKRR